VDLIKKIKTTLSLKTTYQLWKLTREKGVDISINGISNYEKKNCSSMRLDALLLWQELCQEKGIEPKTFLSWIKKDLKKSTSYR
jgi:hypothetical protein